MASGMVPAIRIVGSIVSSYVSLCYAFCVCFVVLPSESYCNSNSCFSLGFVVCFLVFLLCMVWYGPEN